jgi:hypothetical protein
VRVRSCRSTQKKTFTFLGAKPCQLMSTMGDRWPALAAPSRSHRADALEDKTGHAPPVGAGLELHGEKCVLQHGELVLRLLT